MTQARETIISINDTPTTVAAFITVYLVVCVADFFAVLITILDKTTNIVVNG